MKNTNELSTEKKLVTKQNDNKIKSKKTIPKNTLKIHVIILSILIIILLFLICFLFYYFTNKVRNIEQKLNKNENQKSNETDVLKENENSIENIYIKEGKNLIEAVYNIKSGETLLLFNPQEIGLKEEDYFIDAQSVSQNGKNLRNLKLISVDKGLYTPSQTGLLSIKIYFKSNLKNLNCFFKGIKELIKVNLTNLEMKEIKSMNSTFSGCSNLNTINLEGINTTSLKNMEYTFENCHKLRNINLSPVIANELENIIVYSQDVKI